MKTPAADIPSYIKSFPEDVQGILNEILSVIKEAAPQAVAGFSYGMPAFKMNGKPLVYFAAFKSHIGFYATPTGHQEFAKELSVYKQGKGSVQFPLHQPMPLDLIRRITEYRVQISKGL